ncbi:MAG: 23S rRNA (adenine(2503)-C(2))-methyltransferase RlmN [Terracidiphilus sp.]
MREDFPQLAQIEPASPKAEGPPRTLFGLGAEALAALMAETGEPAFRARQLAQALYRQHIADLDAITTLPKALRQRLTAEGWQVGRPAIAQVFQSIDGTERYLVDCRGEGDALETVETVWMPEGDNGESGDESDTDSSEVEASPTTAQNIANSPTRDFREAEASSPHLTKTSHVHKKLGAPGLDSETGETNDPQPTFLSIPTKLGAPSIPRTSAEWVGNHEPQPAQQTTRRATICVSSQIGCAVNCQFCLTARLGLQRNLTAGEIAGQVFAVFDRHAVEVGRDRVNLVFMGMGEPFLNYDSFMGAVRVLVREAGLSPRRMTVSTSGIVPGILRFAQEPPEFRPKLAISLNAPNDALRSQIMPINRKWPIATVLDAARQVNLRPHERITFEYVLLGGTTDRPEDARALAHLIRRSGLAAKVNLIAWNPGPGIHYSTPQPEAVEAFRSALINSGIPAYLRKPRGRDIYAACGQLKRTVEG